MSAEDGRVRAAGEWKANEPGLESRRLPYGTPAPKPDSRWCAEAQAYWRAIGMSDFSLVAQPAQWMMAYVACEVLDRLYLSGFPAGLTKVWLDMSARLGLPKFSLLDAAPAEPATDTDEDESEQAVTDIRSKFKIVEES